MEFDLSADSDGADDNTRPRAATKSAAETPSDVAQESSTVVQLAASKVALLVGLHEFGAVAEAVLELIYQNREEMLESDTKALNLRLVSKDEELRELVAKTGETLASQLTDIVTWTQGRRQPVTQTAAKDLLQSVDGLVTQACSKRKLNEEEAHAIKRQLGERIRQSFGCRNEDLALKVSEDVPTKFEEVEREIERVTINKRARRRRGLHAVGCHESSTLANDLSVANSDDTLGVERVKQQKTTISPLFTICGMIDGVADTLEIASDDEWQLVPILLEVKNRMRSFRVPPPLHEYIQMAVYLKMLGLTTGDLIQCLHADRAQIHVTRVSLAEYPLHCVGPQGRDGADGLWATVLLPRLYSLVHTIENLRRNDLLRLAFLNATGSERIAILRRECDFL